MTSEGPERTQPTDSAPDGAPPLGDLSRAQPPPSPPHLPAATGYPRPGFVPGGYAPPPVYPPTPGFPPPGYFAPPPGYYPPPPGYYPPPPGYAPSFAPGYPPAPYIAPQPGGAGGRGVPPGRRAGIGPWPQRIPDVIGTIFRLYGQNFIKISLLGLLVAGIPALLAGAAAIFGLYLVGFDVTQSFFQNLLPGGGFLSSFGLNLQSYGPTSGQQFVPTLPSLPLLRVSPEQWLLIGIGAAVGVVLYILLTAWQMGVLAIAARDCTLGRPLRIGAALTGGLRRLFPVLGTLILVGLIIAGIYAVFVGSFIALFGFVLEPMMVSQGNSPQDIGRFIALFLFGEFLFYGFFYVTYVYVIVRTGMAPYIAGADAVSPGRSLARSWSLVRGNWWRTFTPLLVIGLALSVATNVLLTPGEFAPLIILFAILLPVVAALTMPLWALAFMVIYYDLRLRREGYLPLAGELGLPTNFPPPFGWPAGAIPPTPPPGPAQSGQSPVPMG